MRICVPPCISDLDKDCEVNMYDIAILGSAWLSSTGDGNWNPVCDISDPNDNTIDELDTIAKVHNATVSQTALNYLLQKPGINALIVGVRTVEQLEENIKTTEWEITPEEVARLDRVSEPTRRYPYYVYNPVKEQPDSS